MTLTPPILTSPNVDLNLTSLSVVKEKQREDTIDESKVFVQFINHPMNQDLTSYLIKWLEFGVREWREKK